MAAWQVSASQGPAAKIVADPIGHQGKAGKSFELCAPKQTPAGDDCGVRLAVLGPI
jgi:hypothetical protein